MVKSHNFRVTVDRHFVMDDFDGRDYVQAAILEKGVLQYEAPLPSFLIAYLAQNEGTFIDVGANTGVFTLLAASVSSRINVVAFEPLHDIYMKLRHNVELNQDLSARITTVKAALSGSSGKTHFYETINDAGLFSTSSSLEFGHVQYIGSEFRTLEVSTVTFDEWAEANDLKDAALMKIDVEGHESAVLQGAISFVKRVRPLIVVELLAGAKYPFFQEFVEACNYMSFSATGEFMRREHRIQCEPGSWNHIFCPVEKIYGAVVAGSAAGLEIR